MKYSTLLLNILKDQVTPALGCTEPISVALAVAAARETIGAPISEVEIKVDKNIYKNAMGVGIPGTDEKGLYMAAALALLKGKSEYKLEVLKDITREDVSKARELLKKNLINVSVKKDLVGLYVEITAIGDNGKARVLIKDKHDNIVLIEKDDKVIFKKEEQTENSISLKGGIKTVSIKDLKEFVDTVDLDKLDLVIRGIEMNERIAEAGMTSKYAKVLSRGMKPADMSCKDYAKFLTSIACYARMSGYPFPVMSCAGSGNHGIIAILPVVAVGEKKQVAREKIIRAVTLSLLVTIYIKSYTGTLTPVCGCGVAAGVGASAGIAYILNGTLNQIEGAIKNMIGTMAGLICDGGKPGCSFKLSISTDAAIESAFMALNGIVISSYDGIIDETAEKTIINLGKVSTDGMRDTDETILNVMISKNQ